MKLIDYGYSAMFEDNTILSAFCLGCGDQRRISKLSDACPCGCSGVFYQTDQNPASILEPVHDYMVQEA